MQHQNFELQISNWVNKVKASVDEAFRGLVLEMAKRIIERTPVKTGYARGQWMAAVNAMPVGTLPADPDGVATLARIAAVVATAKVGDVIYLVNGADYSAALEYGRSEQAPAGMVRVTIMEAPAIAKQVTAKLPR